MNTWDQVGGNYEGGRRKAEVRIATGVVPSLAANRDYQRMQRDHEREFEDAVEYEVQRRRGGE